jgi:ribosomal protein S18 acetylase RimI-like enzyme
MTCLTAAPESKAHRHVTGLWTREAGWGDVQTVLRILRAADDARATAHRRTWGDLFPDLTDRLRRGHVRLAFLGGEPVGTYTLTWSHRELWGIDGGEAGYLHRFAVAPEVAGRGVGGMLLDQAAEQVSARGRRWLRLDCDSDNGGLRAYYERHGFQHRGDVESVPRSTRSGLRDASRYQRACPLPRESWPVAG